MAKVFRIAYHDQANPSRSWTANILAEDENDALRFIQQKINFKIAIDSMSKQIENIDGYTDLFLERIKNKLEWKTKEEVDLIVSKYSKIIKSEDDTKKQESSEIVPEQEKSQQPTKKSPGRPKKVE